MGSDTDGGLSLQGSHVGMQGWHGGAKPPLGAASSSLKQKVKTHGCAIRMGKGGQTSIPPPPHCPATSCHGRPSVPKLAVAVPKVRVDPFWVVQNGSVRPRESSIKGKTGGR